MRVAANGIRFNCAVEGPEGAPWVTLAASIAADLTLWDAQVPALGEHCRVLRFDARGHGATEATEPPYTLDLLVADVRALWDALGIARSHFVGLSLGGMIGIGLALDYPGRVASAVVANSRTEATPEFRALWDERIAVAETDGMAGLVDSTARRWLTPGFIAANPDAVAKVRAMIGRCSVAGFVGAARALQGLDLLPRLKEISVPCLFIAGGEDGACPAGEIRAAASRVPGAEYVELSPAAHISNLEQPDAFNRAVTDFLARHGRGAPAIRPGAGPTG